MINFCVHSQIFAYLTNEPKKAKLYTISFTLTFVGGRGEGGGRGADVIISSVLAQSMAHCAHGMDRVWDNSMVANMLIFLHRFHGA